MTETKETPDPVVQRPKRRVPPPQDPLPKYDWELPNQCDTFKVVYRRKGDPYHKRVRVKWTKEDRTRARKLARMVAREMGADPRLLLLWMDRGSSSNPHAIHVLTRDLRADWNAWKSHQYSPELEAKYRKTLETVSARNAKFWAAKNALRKILAYKDNPYYFKAFEYKEEYPDGHSGLSRHPYFAMKYGPLDMSAVGYTKFWSREAPPWIMCNDDGIIAYIVGVWAMRSFQKQCANEVAHGDSFGVIDRRYARGHCRQTSENFKRRAAAYGINPDERVRLGRKWQRSTTDRKAIYDHMKAKAIEKGLLNADASASGKASTGSP